MHEIDEWHVVGSDGRELAHLQFYTFSERMVIKHFEYKFCILT